MNKWISILNKFLLQTQKNDLKTSYFPKEWDDLKMKISFGMGAQARVPWIAFIAPEMAVSKGFYPVYLFYKESKTLILSYGISETAEYAKTWPAEIMNSTITISSFFNKPVPRYGDSFVFKAYNVDLSKDTPSYQYSNQSTNNSLVTETDIESDLNTILGYYKKTVSVDTNSQNSIVSQGLFYMEKQLEDFIISNWKNTELGEKYDLIIEQGEIISQQYRTDIGQIDILAKDKSSGSYVVIELKKNQTSDDTIGQLARYMGWIKENKKDNNVRGIIISGQYDKKLFYALKMVPFTEVFIYEVNFKLTEFKARHLQYTKELD